MYFEVCIVLYIVSMMYIIVVDSYEDDYVVGLNVQVYLMMLLVYAFFDFEILMVNS